jgi:hypothetical protein
MQLARVSLKNENDDNHRVRHMIGDKYNIRQLRSVPFDRTAKKQKVNVQVY